MTAIFNIFSSITNATKKRSKYIDLPCEYGTFNFLYFLHKHNYIESYEIIEVKNGIQKLRLFFKYFKNKNIIKTIVPISTPANAITIKLKNLKKLNTNGLYVISNSCGLLTIDECLCVKMGGTVVCVIF
jgi:ribosomal protein S8